MKKSLSKAVAVTATCAAGLAGVLAQSPTAIADQADKAPATKGLTNFGMKADVFGTKVLLNGVELKSAKTGYARQNCTRLVGAHQDGFVGTSSLPLPDAVKDLITIDPISNVSDTYRSGNRTGVLGVSKLPQITIGGELPGGVKTPVLAIEGLVSRADAFHDKSTGKFGHAESFKFADISLKYEDTVADGTPLADLLHIVNEVVAPANEIVDQLVELLLSVTGNVIEIPGLGSIALGNATGKADAHSAVSEAYALKVTVDPEKDGKDVTGLQLGRAAARITGGATSGIFNSQMSALNLLPRELAPGLSAIRLGGIGQVSMPCSGTAGKTQGTPTRTAGIPGLFDISGVTYRHMGKQLSQGRQAGFVETRVGSFSLPAADLTVKGLVSRVTMFRKPFVQGQPGRGNTKTFFKTSVGSIQIGDQAIDVSKLKLGDVVDFDGGSLVFGSWDRTYHGGQLRGLVVQLTETDTLIELGIADGYANKK